MSAHELHPFITKRTKESPHHKCVIFDNTELTYQQILNQGRLLLKTLGTPFPRSVLAFILDPSPAVITAFALAELADLIVLPLNPRLPISELESIVEVTKPTIVIASENYQELAGHISKTYTSRVVIVDDFGNALKFHKYNAAKPNQWQEFKDDMLFIATSGTIGIPKIVRITKKNLHSLVAASNTHLKVLDNDLYINAMPCHHIGGLSIILRGIESGIPVILLRKFDEQNFIDLSHRYHATATSLVPTMLKRILDLSDRHLRGLEFRYMLIGGAAAPLELLQDARSFGLPVLTTYGLTEATSQVATLPLNNPILDHNLAGIPLPGVSIKIVNKESHTQGHMDAGEIVVQGPTVSPGYLWPLQANARFSEDGFHTGDIGSLDENGWLRVFGRTDEAINTGGEKVLPEDVENIIRSVLAVDDVIVFGLPDKRYGEIVAAAIVPGNRKIDTASAISQLKPILGPIKTPKKLFIENQLPRSASGKPQRKELRKKYTRHG
jgi:O-succinylbenzoic acid--CoA ligase